MEYYWVPAQVPPFGNWDYSNDLPITQYFDSARQPGLIRHSSSSGDCDLYTADDGGCGGGGNHPPRKKTAARGVRSQGRERKQQPAQQQQATKTKAYDASDGLGEKQWSRRPPQPSRKGSAAVDGGGSKAVDEDLYQIPPDLLYASSAKRKKRFRFIMGCLNPTCSV